MPFRMRDLADQLFVAQSGVTRVVDRLVAQGWVVREQPPDDRRTIYARLTESGRSVVAQAVPVYARTLTEKLAGGLSPEELSEFRRVLRRILERLGAWDDERCDPPEVGEAPRDDPGDDEEAAR